MYHIIFLKRGGIFMKKLFLTIVSIVLLLPLQNIFAEENYKVYTTSDENAAIEQILISEDSLILSFAGGAIYEKFIEIIPYLQIEDEAAIKNAILTMPPSQPNGSLVSKAKELEEQGLADGVIYDELSKIYDPVQYVVNKDGAFIIEFNGIDIYNKDNVLRVRYNKVVVIDAQIEDDKLILDNIEYTLESESE